MPDIDCSKVLADQIHHSFDRKLLERLTPFRFRRLQPFIPVPLGESLGYAVEVFTHDPDQVRNLV